jgi:hypothetical protein
MNMGNYAAAAQAFDQGSKLPHTHPFLKILAADMAQHGGDLQTARLLWQTTYSTSDDPGIKSNAERHLEALQVDETVPRLEALVKQFREKTGQQPTSFFPLLQAGWLHAIPIDPLGHPYKLFADGHVEVQDPESWSFIRQGLQPTGPADTAKAPAKP